MDTKSKTVRLLTCNSSFRAQLIKGALENEGIKSIIYNENAANVFTGGFPAIGSFGVDIFVLEDDYEKAVYILKDNQMIE